MIELIHAGQHAQPGVEWLMNPTAPLTAIAKEVTGQESSLTHHRKGDREPEMQIATEEIFPQSTGRVTGNMSDAGKDQVRKINFHQLILKTGEMVSVQVSMQNSCLR